MSMQLSAIGYGARLTVQLRDLKPTYSSPIKFKVQALAQTVSRQTQPVIRITEKTGNQEKTLQQENSFSWNRQWYPLIPLAYLDPSRPRALTVLGKKVVVWADKNGKWTVFADQCPHRLAPLSEGRVDEESGNLMCSYHGWQFNAEGACQSVPQAPGVASSATICGSRGACATSYPTQIAQGLLWFWPQPGSQGAETSKTAQPNLIPDLLDDSSYMFGTWYMREMPISFDMILENLVDPSHVFFSHHGVLGKRTDSVPLTFTVLPPATESPGGIRVTCDAEPGKAPEVLEFRAPCMIRGQLSIKGSHLTLISYCVPVRPGLTRLMSTSVTDNAAFKPFARLNAAMPWIGHLTSNEVNDGDLVLIAMQEGNLLDKGPNLRYYMPTPADAAVKAFRGWWTGPGGSGAEFGHSAPGRSDTELKPKRAMLDRYEQHTKNCPACSKALARVQLGERVTKVLAFGLGILAASAVLYPPGSGALVQSPFPLAAASAASFLLSLALQGLSQKFIYVDYVHAEKK